jgi:energy-coupling factor transporter ATP-binding protein EcfA2
MPYVPLSLLQAAVEALRGKHPLAVLVLPTMVREGVDVVADPTLGVQYGSEAELRVLREFFTVPGAPPDKPFRAVWEDKPDEAWRDERYPGRSLQRMRSDRVGRGSAFFQRKRAGGRDSWGLRDTCGQDIATERGFQQVRIVDLAIWYGREEDVADLDALVNWFRATFPVDRDRLIGTVYTEEIPTHYPQQPFSPTPLTQDDYAVAVGALPAATTVTGDLLGLAHDIYTCIQAKRFQLTEDLVLRVLNAWARGDIVVLLGQPGTGKSTFAALMVECLKAILGDLKSVFVPIHADFDETELIGFEKLNGEPELRDFAQQVLRSDSPLSPHVVVLEEFNLATLETYLSAILIATQDPERRVSLPANEQSSLPVDTFILATCNSYLDEPETRTRLSFPSKRRCSVITMPNMLAEQFEARGNVIIMERVMDLIRQEEARIQGRVNQGRGASFDQVRLASLGSVNVDTDLSDRVRRNMTAIFGNLLGSNEGREFLTLGILRDVSLAVCYAQRVEEAEMRALGEQLADKIVHQLRGPKTLADAFQATLADMPNQPEIGRLLERMKSGPGDQLMALL